jgi:hypothetical protein
MPAPVHHCESIIGQVGRTWIWGRNKAATFVNAYYAALPNPQYPAHGFGLAAQHLNVLWKTTTPAQRAQWYKIAVRRNLPAYTAFMSANLERFHAGQPYITSPQ